MLSKNEIQEPKRGDKKKRVRLSSKCKQLMSRNCKNDSKMNKQNSVTVVFVDFSLFLWYEQWLVRSWCHETDAKAEKDLQPRRFDVFIVFPHFYAFRNFFFHVHFFPEFLYFSSITWHALGFSVSYGLWIRFRVINSVKIYSVISETVHRTMHWAVQTSTMVSK